MLQAANHPPINLISEKVAFQGVTRFDDRYRLPLGISVNMAAFSATLMAEVSFQPKILLPYLHLGLENEMAIQDVRSPASPSPICLVLHGTLSAADTHGTHGTCWLSRFTCLAGCKPLRALLGHWRDPKRCDGHAVLDWVVEEGAAAGEPVCRRGGGAHLLAASGPRACCRPGAPPPLPQMLKDLGNRVHVVVVQTLALKCRLT